MLISLIVPVYNLAAYLGDTLASVAAARRNSGLADAEIEAIFIDDGSTDASGSILDECAGRGEIVAIHQANGGEGSARNAGLAAAQGEYVMFLDGDDVLLPNALSCAAILIRSFPKADVFNMRFAMFNDGDPVPSGTDDPAPRQLDTDRAIPAELVCRLGVFPSLFRRGKFGDRRFTQLPLGADREYVLACLAQSDAVVLSESIVGGYRQRGGSMAHARWNERKIRSLNDHVVLALGSLAACGKRIDPAGAGYLASLVVSEVPARLARLDAADAGDGMWRHWIESVRELPAGILPLRVRVMRRLILAAGGVKSISIGAARIGRALGVA